MTGCPSPAVTASPSMDPATIHASAGEPFVVPSQAANKAGGMETLRLMLSKDGATNFAKTKLSSTIVKDTVPDDAFGSTALASQIAMLEAAGENTFTFNFNEVYGFTSQNNVLWNSFLSGELDVAGLTAGLQQQADETREDDSITKVEVS
jgi:N-acetylglucosamine transport system substrate-binding protein